MRRNECGIAKRGKEMCRNDREVPQCVEWRWREAITRKEEEKKEPLPCGGEVGVVYREGCDRRLSRLDNVNKQHVI